MQAVRWRGSFSRPDVKCAVLESRDEVRTSVDIMYYDAAEDFFLRLTEELKTRTALRLVSDPAGDSSTSLVRGPAGHYQSSGQQVTERIVKHEITIVVLEPNGEIPVPELEGALRNYGYCDRHTFFIWTREQDHHQDTDVLPAQSFRASTVTMVFPHAAADRQPLFWDTLARFIGKSHKPCLINPNLSLSL